MTVSHIALFALVGNMPDSQENMTVGHVGIGMDSCLRRNDKGIAGMTRSFKSIGKVNFAATTSRP